MPDDDTICWPTGGEIDIMEGYRPTPGGGDSVLMTYHWAEKCGVDEWDKKYGTYPNIPTWTSSSSPPVLVDWSNEFHTFSVEWKKDSIEWYVDGVSRYVRSKGKPENLFIPDVPFYMILNTAMVPWSNATADVGLPLEHIIDSVTWCERVSK
jgi:beta-glucanase (GH16 family)